MDATCCTRLARNAVSAGLQVQGNRGSKLHGLEGRQRLIVQHYRLPWIAPVRGSRRRRTRLSSASRRRQRERTLPRLVGGFGCAGCRG